MHPLGSLLSVATATASRHTHLFAMNKRSTTADEYRKLYYTKRWKQLRGTILTRDGYRCQRCKVTLTNGRSDPRSAVVHHIKPHKGDLIFFNDPANLEAYAGAVTQARSNRKKCWGTILKLELMGGLLIKEIWRLFNFNVKQFFVLFNIFKHHVTNVTARRS